MKTNFNRDNATTNFFFSPSEFKGYIHTNSLISRKSLILADENTLELCLPYLLKEIPDFENAEILQVESGEESKDIEICSSLWDLLSELKADRNSLLINLGGGVVSDIGGFVASTYKRGISFINIPTTLLGMVDAAIGGKNGINIEGAKNQVGTFSQPLAVCIFPEFLKTLPKRQIKNAYAEMIKTALVADPVLWKELQTTTPDNINENIIFKVAGLKDAICFDDPFEAGKRSMLNFGHTIGHALESLSMDGRIPALLHGEAIAWGMVAEAFISNKLVGLPNDDMIQIVQLIKKHFKSFNLSENTYKALKIYMLQDKKNNKYEIRFTLLKKPGEPVLYVPVQEGLINESYVFLSKTMR